MHFGQLKRIVGTATTSGTATCFLQAVQLMAMPAFWTGALRYARQKGQVKRSTLRFIPECTPEADVAGARCDMATSASLTRKGVSSYP